MNDSLNLQVRPVAAFWSSTRPVGTFQALAHAMADPQV